MIANNFMTLYLYILSFLWIQKEIGVNISGVNPDHLPEDVRASRTTKRGFKMNFIECSIDESTKEMLFNKLKTQYGAIRVENYDGIIIILLL
jgi:hypothetical protein